MTNEAPMIEAKPADTVDSPDKVLYSGSLASAIALEEPKKLIAEQAQDIDQASTPTKDDSIPKPTEEDLKNPKKYIQKQTFHAMCAFLHGYHFELTTDVDYKKDNRFEDWDRDRFADSFYQDAFKQEVRVKCKYCVTPDLEISILRTKKFDQFKLN